MELEKFDRQLRLMVLLTQNRNLSVEDISRQTGMSRRTVYRYIKAFQSMGFVVKKTGTRYRLDHTSPFFSDITSHIHFTLDEAATINQVLSSVSDSTPQVRHLREKLAFIYDFDTMAKHGVDEHIARNLSVLYRAVREERMCVLHDYQSGHSQLTSDRVVEPYLFLAGNTEVRCLEVDSHTNKTFRISRAKSVTLLDLNWAYKNEHKPFFTDLFHFSGEERTRVRLLLGPLSASLLREEFPEAEKQLKPLPDGRTLLDTQVCSYKGIGRFVLGLYDDIEIDHSPDFSHYIRQRIAEMGEKLRR